VDRQLNTLHRSNLDQRLRLGSRLITRRDLKETLEAFRQLLTQNLSPEAFNRAVHERFEIIEAGKGRAGSRRMLFTGYFTPIIDANRHRTAKHRYPLYRKPKPFPTRMVSWGPAADNRDYGFHTSAEPRKLLLTRKQIDGDFALQDRNLEIAWLEDDLDRYFLHIQGSGYLRFADDTVQSVRFDGSNQLPYKSVGRQMIEDGVITENEGSMQGIKRYFRRHPENIQRYLFQNRRYIFFELTDRGPTGSAGVELVPGRSIATDKKLYPGGGLAFITAKKPVLDENNRIIGWQKFSRFVLDQDTGSAIKGPGRADLYFGVGDSAGAAAGQYYQRGRIVYLLEKK
jgi:membrane-bound lytic murein transglycosylase A